MAAHTSWKRIYFNVIVVEHERQRRRCRFYGRHFCLQGGGTPSNGRVQWTSFIVPRKQRLPWVSQSVLKRKSTRKNKPKIRTETRRSWVGDEESREPKKKELRAKNRRRRSRRHLRQDARAAAAAANDRAPAVRYK